MKKILLILLIFYSCSYPEMIRNEIIFESDFESGINKNIDGGSILEFNNTLLIGNFNNDGFSLNIEDIGSHDYIAISFDLYIHGTWDGNFNGFENNDKPDKWIIEFNPGMDLYKNPSTDYFITTFSNSPCFSNYCLRQSYPEKYPFENNPKTGVYETNLPETCPNSYFGGKTSLYKIEKIFKSSGDAVRIRFYDELYQPNAVNKDGVNESKCDESWSLDNLKIRAIRYQ